MCIELNAHAMIVYALTIRDHFQGDARNFLPWMLGSQTCERMFRTVRSMSSIYSTMLNFSILGLLRRLHRLNIQLTLQAELKETIKFPNVQRHRNKEGKNEISGASLRTIKDNEISEAVKRANAKAKQTLCELGMDKLLRVHSTWDNENTTGDLLAGVQDDDDDDHDNLDDCGHDDETDEKDCSSLEIIKEIWSESQEEVSEDIQSACDKGLVSKEANKSFCKALQKALPVNKLKSDTIPMYTLKGHNDLNSYLASLNAKQIISPYVEVSVKGRVVLIRKTTAIWLFQETEYVSADRIFRVRFKQPYTSTNESKETASVKFDGWANNAVAEKASKNDSITVGTLVMGSSGCHSHDDVADEKVVEGDKMTSSSLNVNSLECIGKGDVVANKSEIMTVDTSISISLDLHGQADTTIDKDIIEPKLNQLNVCNVDFDDSQ